MREAQSDRRADLATEADLAALRQEVKSDLADFKAEIFRGGFAALLGQTAVLAALVKLL